MVAQALIGMTGVVFLDFSGISLPPAAQSGRMRVNIFGLATEDGLTMRWVCG
jgi:hypothetical protein